MMEAISIHDKTMRSRLSEFYGYECMTEGDAFLLAFHEAKDAAAWAMTTQQVCQVSDDQVMWMDKLSVCHMQV